MMIRRPLELFDTRRVRLAALAVGAIVPFSAFIAYQIMDYRERLTKDALQQAIHFARLGADSFEDTIAEARTVLELASLVPVVTNGPADACQSFLRSIEQSRDWANGIWVVGENGRVRCSTIANGTDLDLSDRASYKQSVAAPSFRVSDFFVSKLRNHPAAVATLPTYSVTTGERMLLAITLNLTWFQRLAKKIGQPSGAAVVLLDGKGAVLSSFPGEQDLVGRNLANLPVVQKMLQGSDGQFEGASLDGKQALWGYVTLAGTNLRLAVNFERNEVLKTVDRGTVQAIAMLALIALLVGGLIWHAGDRIFAAPLRKLDELLQATLENMHQGLIVVDAQGTIAICNRHAMDLLDLPSKLMSARPRTEDVIAYQRSQGEFANLPDKIQHRLAPLTQGETTNTYERERPNGTIIEVRTVPFADGGVVRTYTDVTERRRAERLLVESNDRLAAANEMLETLAHQDALTGLANRRQLDTQIGREFGRARRTGSSVALVMIDVDNFKAYNDRYGHPAGDDCLRAVAKVVRENVKRPADLAARYGGEEIAILLPDTDMAGAKAVAEQVRKAINGLMIEHGGGLEGTLTISAGVSALVPTGERKPSDLIRKADQALYQAKNTGRNRVVVDATVEPETMAA